MVRSSFLVILRKKTILSSLFRIKFCQFSLTFYQDRRCSSVGLMCFYDFLLKSSFLFKSQLQMRRVEEFEAWEACKRKHQGFIRTKTTARCEQFCGLKF